MISFVCRVSVTVKEESWEAIKYCFETEKPSQSGYWSCCEEERD